MRRIDIVRWAAGVIDESEKRAELRSVLSLTRTYERCFHQALEVHDVKTALQLIPEIRHAERRAEELT